MVVNSWMSPTCPVGPKETSSVWENSPIDTLRQSLEFSSILDQANCREVRHGCAGWSEPSSPQAFLLDLLAHWWAFWRKKRDGTIIPKDQAFIRPFISGFLPFSDGWVKRRYRPNVQQFAGRDGSPDSGKFSFLTFKLGKKKNKKKTVLLNLILIWQESYLSNDWKLTMLYSPALTEVGEKNKGFFLIIPFWVQLTEHMDHTHILLWQFSCSWCPNT